MKESPEKIDSVDIQEQQEKHVEYKKEIIDRHAVILELVEKNDLSKKDFNDYLEWLCQKRVIEKITDEEDQIDEKRLRKLKKTEKEEFDEILSGLIKEQRGIYRGKLGWKELEKFKTQVRELSVRVVDSIDKNPVPYTLVSRHSLARESIKGTIFKSLPELRKKTIENDQLRKKHSKNKTEQQTELLNRFEKLLQKPLRLLTNLEKTLEQKKALVHSPIELLRHYANQLNKAIKSDEITLADHLIIELENLGVKDFGKKDFEEKVLPEAKKRHIMEKTSENQFTREDNQRARKEKRYLMEKPDYWEIYYQYWEHAPKKHIRHIDVYTFKGNKESEIENWIFNDLKQCARMVEYLEKIQYLMGKPYQELRQKQAEQEAERKAADKAIERVMHKESQAKQKRTREFQLIAPRKDWKDQLKELHDQMEPKKVTPKKVTPKKVTPKKVTPKKAKKIIEKRTK